MHKTTIASHQAHSFYHRHANSQRPGARSPNASEKPLIGRDPAIQTGSGARAAPEASSSLADPAREMVVWTRDSDPITKPDSEAVTHRTNCHGVTLACKIMNR
jgi:hypothetical protein